MKNLNLEPLSFTWPVPESGFQWQKLIAQPLFREPESTPSDALVRRSPGDSEIQYCPMDEQELFLKFAACQPRQEEILSFANRYGLLNGRTSFVRSTIIPSQIVFGDTLDEWIEEIRSINDAMDLWRALVVSDAPARLKKRIQWLPKVIRWTSAAGGTTILRRNDSPCDEWTAGDLITPAKFFLAEKINQGVASRVVPRLTVDSVGGKIRRSLRAANLAGVIWYQFYSAFTGETRLGLCASCELPMPYVRKTKRMHSWCSNKKRQAKFKENQANG
ncbi:MAG: hypothetical protein ACR2NN_08255 [Bryobacteraceae bacterium]